MKKVAVSLIALVAFAGTAFAAPEVIEMKASMGNVKFGHKAHQDKLQDCTKCHATKEGGKIAGFGKDLAHKTCKGCHADMKKGPTGCKECHKK